MELKPTIKALAIVTQTVINLLKLFVRNIDFYKKYLRIIIIIFETTEEKLIISHVAVCPKTVL